MRFVDETIVEAWAGDGGDGCAAMRREAFIPFGGPAGGDGGVGGSVILRADNGLGTLLDLQFRRVIKADPGEHGRGKDQYGKAGKSLTVRVPVGTQVYDDETGELIADLDKADDEVVVAKGGQGGLGNKHFATPWNRAPMRAEPGHPGEHRRLRLELKVMADVGILGFPNAGKSTFIARVSRARPKIADYPFTTLTPNLGVVSVHDQSFVIADIPGIIEGAAEGAGLGIRFLKHLERTRALLVLVSVDDGEGRTPLSDYDTLIEELEKFDPDLAKRPKIVAFGKMDRPDAQEALVEFKKAMKKRRIEVHPISSVTGEGTEALLGALYKIVEKERPDPAKKINPLPI